MMREIGVPILIGVLVGASVFLIPEPDPPEPFVPTVEDLGVTFPFEAGPRIDAANGTVLVLADPEQPMNITWPQTPVPDELTGEDVVAPAPTAAITWHNEHIGTVQVEDRHIQCIRAPCPEPAAPWLTQYPETADRFDAANGTVRLTLYAFNTAGELLASNAPARDLDRFPISGDFVLLGGDPWFVGNGTAPVGAMELPFGADLAATALDGLPVGGIATIHVVEHPFAWAVGELWLTGRIDGFS